MERSVSHTVFYSERETERDRERQRDRERDRETERHRDSERHRETERQRDREKRQPTATCTSAVFLAVTNNYRLECGSSIYTSPAVYPRSITFTNLKFYQESGCILFQLDLDLDTSWILSTM